MSPRDFVRPAPPTPAATLIDTEPQVDMRRLRGYRLSRVQSELKKRDLGACVLFDPINIRYATGTRNMSVWTLHNAARYAFVPAEGKAVMFEFHNCEHLSSGLETVDEVRPATGWFYFVAGPEVEARAKLWADEVADVMAGRCGGNRRLAVDLANPPGARALEAHGVTVFDGQEVLERARAVKSADEIACMTVSIAVAEAGMARMREALAPGITENRLWAMLHETNIAMGGEWIECRLLASGRRTNPWFQECSDKIIRPGELVGLDTDMVGPFGYCADVSRTWFCGPGRPSAEQRRLYALAHEQIHHDAALLRPGLGFRELAERAWRIPDEFVKNRYGALVHGIGMCDEYPLVSHRYDWNGRGGYDGVLEENMTVCVESYIGAENGAEGVKLEDVVLITADGPVILSTFPFEDELLA